MSMSAPNSRRLSWMIFPLAVIAWMAAPEWPARAGMMDNPWRDGWFPIASAWAEVHPVPYAVAQTSPEVINTTPSPEAVKASVLTAVVSAPILKQTDPASSATTMEVPRVQATDTEIKVAPTNGIVLMLGDSLMGEVAAGLRQHLPRAFKVIDKHKSSTGLTNLNYYDWPSTAAADVTQANPQWVIVHLGANDAQDMHLNGKWVSFSSAEWQQVYLVRAILLLKQIRKNAPSSVVIWVGLPSMRSASFDKRMDVIRGIQKQAAQSQSVLYLDGHEALGKIYEKDGVVAGGVRAILRQDDGIHYSRAGGEQIAHEAAKAVDFPWNAP